MGKDNFDFSTGSKYDEEGFKLSIENNKNEQALRYNEGKPELSYVLDVMPALKDMVAVMEFGAKKYERNNWKKGFEKGKLLDSMLRHISAFYSGEDVDPESGLPHVGHILCNAAFLGYHYGSNSQYWLENVEESEDIIEDLIGFLNRDVLIQGVEVDYPAGIEAGHRVTLNLEGEESIQNYLKSRNVL